MKVKLPISDDSWGSSTSNEVEVEIEPEYDQVTLVFPEHFQWNPDGLDTTVPERRVTFNLSEFRHLLSFK